MLLQKVTTSIQIIETSVTAANQLHSLKYSRKPNTAKKN